MIHCLGLQDPYIRFIGFIVLVYRIQCVGLQNSIFGFTVFIELFFSDDPNWKSVAPRGESCPKQSESSQDCAIFILRNFYIAQFLYCAIFIT